MWRKAGIESTPLLGPGFHVMTLDGLRSLTVTGFAEPSAKRRDLFAKFERLVGELVELEIPSEIWVDGSFLTEEVDPWDIDLAVKVMDDVMQKLSKAQDEFLTRLSADHEHYIDGLDTFVFAGYWRGHPLYSTDVDDGYSRTVPSWGYQFGLGRDGWLKGIAVVPILENDIGLRLRT